MNPLIVKYQLSVGIDQKMDLQYNSNDDRALWYLLPFCDKFSFV